MYRLCREDAPSLISYLQGSRQLGAAPNGGQPSASNMQAFWADSNQGSFGGSSNAKASTWLPASLAMVTTQMHDA